MNALLTTRYVHLDDRILPTLGFSRAHRSGRKRALNDVGLLCLIVAQHLLGIASDRKRVRYAHAHLSGMFPNLLIVVSYVGAAATVTRGIAGLVL